MDTVFDSERSACCGVTVALAELLPGFPSVWSLCEIVAVFVLAEGETTVAWICSVWEVAFATVPTVQSPEPGE